MYVCSTCGMLNHFQIYVWWYFLCSKAVHGFMDIQPALSVWWLWVSQLWGSNLLFASSFGQIALLVLPWVREAAQGEGTHWQILKMKAFTKICIL